MSEKVECPNCLGEGIEFKKGRWPNTCSLCKGKKEVSPELEEDYISNINIDFDEIFGN